MNEYPPDWEDIALRTKAKANFRCVRCDQPHNPEIGYTLTVHHLDMDKANCEWWNLAALCQRCHLKVQARIKMNQVFMFGHSAWMKPFIEGRNAHQSQTSKGVQ